MVQKFHFEDAAPDLVHRAFMYEIAALLFCLCFCKDITFSFP